LWIFYVALLISYVVAGLTISAFHRPGPAPEFEELQQIWWRLAIPFLVMASVPWIAVAIAPLLVWLSRWQDRHNSRQAADDASEGTPQVTRSALQGFILTILIAGAFIVVIPALLILILRWTGALDV
jgi:hypothetical protein